MTNTPEQLREALAAYTSASHEHDGAAHAQAGLHRDYADLYAREMAAVEAEKNGDGKAKYTNQEKRETACKARMAEKYPDLVAAVEEAERAKRESASKLSRAEQELKSLRVLLAFETAQVEHRTVELRAQMVARDLVPF